MFATASLRRSFGILPANRGVVSRGAYRFVRHPMYLGYFVTDLGFLLVNFGLQNLLVYGCRFALQWDESFAKNRFSRPTKAIAPIAAGCVSA